MTIPAASNDMTIRYFSGTRVYLWNCIVKARQSLGLRKLQPEPIMHWIKIVFGVCVIYDIETMATALGIVSVSRPKEDTLAEHDVMLSDIFETDWKY